MHKILFATSEAYPLVTTGGLSEVSGALPVELYRMGLDVRVVLPGYRSVLAACTNVRVVAQLALPASAEPVRILEGALGRSAVPLYVVDAPAMFDRPGGPYTDPADRDWPDNASRFTVFCRAAVELGMNRAGLQWQPDVVHCHDWQSGLIPALLAREPARPAAVFTIHNIAYMGNFDRTRFETLELPADLFRPEAMEFYGQFAFIKGGLVFADLITTVSPTYAREIQTPQYGSGLDGLMRHRSGDLVGILNGVDYELWDPSVDTEIATRYDAESLERKSANKRALQLEIGLHAEERAFVLGVVSRLAHQKGIDLLPEALAPLWREGVQLAVLGTGDGDLQKRIAALAAGQPGQCGAYFGYNDSLSHRVVAGADALVMPSRYEPCGLSQLYCQRYGTVPIVRRTGGLADSVTPVNAGALDADMATGVVFDEASAAALASAVRAAMFLYRAPSQWRRVQLAGMQRDFGWSRSARRYAEVYRRARLQRR